MIDAMKTLLTRSRPRRWSRTRSAWLPLFVLLFAGLSLPGLA